MRDDPKPSELVTAVRGRRTGARRRHAAPTPGMPGDRPVRGILPPMITYAQNFEDVLLRRALSDIERGFYIDVGAFHPVVDNVTCWFYGQGWSGINVEPNPRFHTLLCTARPHDLNLAAAVAGKTGVLELHLLDGLSTTVGTVAAQHARTGRASEGTTRVEALSLSDLFVRHVGTREVDFLKIDVEGAEAAILDACPFDTVRPRLLVVEATEPDGVGLTSTAWEAGLVGKGYIFCYFDGLNRYFVRTEDAWRQALFDAPPNVFDQFRLAFTDRRVDYVASAGAVLDQTPEGGISALIAERDRLRVERDGFSVQMQSLAGERDALALAVRSEQVGHEAALRAEYAAFAHELAALMQESAEELTALAGERDALAHELAALEQRLSTSQAALIQAHAQIAQSTSIRDASLVAEARLQIKLDALHHTRTGI